MTRLQKLKRLRSLVNFENASFGRVGPAANDPDVALPTSEDEVTDFIRARTELYRDSWINPLIDELIEREERKRERAAARRSQR